MGIYVIRAPSLDEANQVAGSDPFHDTGVRSYEIVECGTYTRLWARVPSPKRASPHWLEEPRKVS